MRRHIHRISSFLSAVALAAAVCQAETIVPIRLVSERQETAKVPSHGRALTSGSEKIIVALGTKIVLLDRTSNTVLWESKGLRGAHCLAALPDGEFVVGEGNSIARVDKNGNVVSRATASFKQTTDVKSLEGGTLLVSDGPAGTIVEMNWSGNVTWSISGLHHPSEAVRLESGDTLVADGTAQLKWFDSAGKLVRKTGCLPRWAASVQQVPGGHILVGESLAVQLLDGAGRALWSRTSSSRVTSVQQLPSGEYLIAEPDAKRIVILDANGNFAWEFAGLESPWHALYVQ